MSIAALEPHSGMEYHGAITLFISIAPPNIGEVILGGESTYWFKKNPGYSKMVEPRIMQEVNDLVELLNKKIKS